MHMFHLYRTYHLYMHDYNSHNDSYLNSYKHKFHHNPSARLGIDNCH